MRQEEFLPSYQPACRSRLVQNCLCAEGRADILQSIRARFEFTAFNSLPAYRFAEHLGVIEIKDFSYKAIQISRYQEEQLRHSSITAAVVITNRMHKNEHQQLQ